MPKIRILTPDSGPNGARNVGDVDTVSAAEAKRLCDAGRAEMVRGGSTRKETTSKSDSSGVEKAVTS